MLSRMHGCLLLALLAAAAYGSEMAVESGSSSGQYLPYKAERTVTITIQYPLKSRGKALYLRGDACGLSWTTSVPMAAVSGHTDTYQSVINCSSTTIGQVLQFKPMVDSTWAIGANYQVEMRYDAVHLTIAPFFFTTTGSYHTLTNDLYSPQLNNTRPIVVYTPPSYSENPYKQYQNVLLMHDGQNLFNKSTCFMGNCWYIQNTIDELVNEGRMEEVIVVGAWNTGITRTYEYTYSMDPSKMPLGGGGDKYLDFLEETLLPLVLKSYRIDVPNMRLGLGGSSLGGLITCYAAWTRPHVYDVAICMSSSFWWNSADFNSTIMSSFPPPRPPMQPLIYTDSGNCCPAPDGDDRVQTYNVHEHMLDLGYTLNSTLFYYMQKGGQHNEVFWGERFWVPMTYLFPPSTTPM